MKRIHLQKCKSFPWYESENVYARGILYGPDNTLYQGEDILHYFATVDSFTDIEERAKYANGMFSVICKHEDKLFAAVDANRIFPLFFARYKGEWFISDDPFYLSEITSYRQINTLANTEFLACGYVTGDDTLLENIRQFQAGEIVQFTSDDLLRKFYHSYRIHRVLDDDYQTLKEKAFEILDQVSKRFIAGLQNKPVVLPLSGGFDSRLVACILKRAGYKNVFCITYGRKGNKEVRKSAEVAQKLGFKWIFVEYNNFLIRDFVNDPDFKSYYPFSAKLSSMFYMQEYFAVKYLKEKELIPLNSVFIPGLYGDFIAGGMLNKHGNLSLEESIEQIAERIYRVKYIYKQPSSADKRKIVDRIEKNLESKFIRGSDLAYSIHEDWDYKERNAKFIANSTSIYRYFGYEFRLFYTDKSWINFFRLLPLHAKINKYLYDDMLTNHIFEEEGINFRRELQPKEREVQFAKVKNRIKVYLPEKVKRLFIQKKDDLFYNEITRQFRSDLAKKGKRIKISGNSYNSLIIQWYSEKVREMGDPNFFKKNNSRYFQE